MADKYVIVDKKLKLIKKFKSHRNYIRMLATANHRACVYRSMTTQMENAPWLGKLEKTQKNQFAVKNGNQFIHDS